MLNDFRYGAGQFTVSLSELVLTGTDVKSFLQTQSTYDIDSLSPESFQLISFLDPHGRVESYGWLLFTKNQYSYLVPQTLVDKSIVRLNKFLISEDVTISDPVPKACTFVLGPLANVTGPKGILFDEETFLFSAPVDGLDVIPEEDVELWRGLTGWPRFDGSDFTNELLNNLRLYDLTLVPNKGCYPGQETVAKIATRRGAAYSPVLLELSEPAKTGELISFGKKIGTAFACYKWDRKHYLSSSLLRDFRVENMKVHFSSDGKEHDGLVRYLPLIQGNRQTKAVELFHKASELFMKDELEKAETFFRKSISIQPDYADSYEALGVMLGRQERFQEAIELMKQLSEVDPKSVLAHTNMSLYLMRIGKITEAEEQKSLATVKSFQSFGDEAKRKEAESQKKEKQKSEWEQRETMFRQVLEIDPDDTLANYGLGSIAVERQDWEQARNYLERVLKQDPKYSVAYLALGKALKGLGKKQEAIAIWKEGVKVSAAKGDLMPANQMQQELSQNE